jgi:Xaa-Pro aminopeptidase
MPSPRGWQVRQGVEYDQRDRTLMALFAEYEGKTSASALQGLRRAIREGGASKGKLGFDDPRVLNWLQADGLTGLKGADAVDIFKEIRMVKTDNEIDILREAARRNETALDYAISQIAPGLPLEEIELAHARKWSELQGRGRWLIANIHCLNSGVCAKGDFMKLDSVGVYKGYNGDVGRTVVIGPPTDELARRIEANTKASKAVYAAIKPGMTFREASLMWIDLMRQEGVPTGFAGAHNVGIDHTDEPFPTGVLTPGGFDGNYNLTFEDGTVFTLDMPYGEIGWGTTHVEDMIAIRKHGFEYLSSGDTSLRIRSV